MPTRLSFLKQTNRNNHPTTLLPHWQQEKVLNQNDTLYHLSVDGGRSVAYSLGMSVSAVAVAQKVARANQAETARGLGVSRAYLSRMLRGERRVTLKVGVELSKRLGVSAEELSEYLEGMGVMGSGELSYGKKFPRLKVLCH